MDKEVFNNYMYTLNTRRQLIISIINNINYITNIQKKRPQAKAYTKHKSRNKYFHFLHANQKGEHVKLKFAET